jgi:NAD(P)H-hydrate epimerase
MKLPDTHRDMQRNKAHILDRAASRAIDHEATRRYGMPSILLMENAAIALRHEALAMLHASSSIANHQSTIPRVLILCGSGNNGGDGYALARHLHNADCQLRLVRIGIPREGSDAAINYDICRRMDLPIVDWRSDLDLSEGAPDLVVDAIFGTGLDRPIERESAHGKAIASIDALGRAVLAADIPSGLDCDTGQPLGIAVRATRTVSFAGIKRGFIVNSESRRYTGEVVIGDIGVPRELVAEFAARL